VTSESTPHPQPVHAHKVVARDSTAKERHRSIGSAGNATGSDEGVCDGAHAIRWPEGTEVVPFENVEGILLITARLRSSDGTDTMGTLALDTGAGYLALDRELAVHLGVSDSVGPPGRVDLAERPLTRLAIGGLEVDQVSPVLVIEGEVIRRVTDRPVLGLLGQRPLSDRAVWIDFDSSRVALIPVDNEVAHDEGGHAVTGGDAAARISASRRDLSTVLVDGDHAIPFRLVGDGKMVVDAMVSNPTPPATAGPLRLIVDTGATKSVFFEDSLARRVPESGRWHWLRGLSVPTLVGNSSAAVAMVPTLTIGTSADPVRQNDTDVAVLHSELSASLSAVTGISIDGLLGSGFLQHYRVIIDYPHQVLWLAPRHVRVVGRPYEYSHVGVQIERREGVLKIVAVAEGSPAANAGITIGDEITEVNGIPAHSEFANTELGVVRATRMLEGPPGTRVTLSVRHGDQVRTYHLVRRRLL
jgi:predicted aspartyl protease